MIYCDYERGLFSVSEFLHHGDGTIVKPEIHDVNPMHYATGGALVNPDPDLRKPIPGIAAIMYDDVTRKVRVAANVLVTISPGGEFIEIGPLHSVEDRVPGQTTQHVDSDKNEHRLLAIQLYQMALELPINALQELVDRAKNLGNL